MLFVVFTTTILSSCEDKSSSEDIDRPKAHDIDYLITTRYFADSYITPEKANLSSDYKNIIGHWYSIELKKLICKLDSTSTEDNKQEDAKYYNFTDVNRLQKYFEKNPHYIINEIEIEETDVLSPFKEYAEYYGDTAHIVPHFFGELGHLHQNVCINPVLTIDVTCNKDFDETHPKGTKLNDIIYYEQHLDTYNYLQNKDNIGKRLYSESGDIEEFTPRKLSDFKDNPLYLMESEYHLIFEHEPIEPGTYEFTVKFTFGPDPLTNEPLEIAPATVSIDF